MSATAVAIAYSTAIIVVALVLRDVVLTVLAVRSRAADVEALRKECEHDRSMLHTWVGEAAKHGDAIETLKGEVSVLKTTANLRGGR